MQVNAEEDDGTRGDIIVEITFQKMVTLCTVKLFLKECINNDSLKAFLEKQVRRCLH